MLNIIESNAYCFLECSKCGLWQASLSRGFQVSVEVTWALLSITHASVVVLIQGSSQPVGLCGAPV